MSLFRPGLGTYSALLRFICLSKSTLVPPSLRLCLTCYFPSWYVVLTWTCVRTNSFVTFVRFPLGALRNSQESNKSFSSRTGHLSRSSGVFLNLPKQECLYS